ncbi:hypothetical protein VTJ83DRAFT_7088 [Remersonia thermophila]|uniref:Uncharacterized protein n=1 Tax=Remersonia thermophila TaxID=72144 RepID=A0ABR4D2G8_9PEZI
MNSVLSYVSITLRDATATIRLTFISPDIAAWYSELSGGTWIQKRRTDDHVIRKVRGYAGFRAYRDGFALDFLTETECAVWQQGQSRTLWRTDVWDLPYGRLPTAAFLPNGITYQDLGLPHPRIREVSTSKRRGRVHTPPSGRDSSEVGRPRSWERRISTFEPATRMRSSPDSMAYKDAGRPRSRDRRISPFIPPTSAFRPPSHRRAGCGPSSDPAGSLAGSDETTRANNVVPMKEPRQDSTESNRAGMPKIERDHGSVLGWDTPGLNSDPAESAPGAEEMTPLDNGFSVKEPGENNAERSWMETTRNETDPTGVVVQHPGISSAYIERNRIPNKDTCCRALSQKQTAASYPVAPVTPRAQLKRYTGFTHEHLASTSPNDQNDSDSSDANIDRRTRRRSAPTTSDSEDEEFYPPRRLPHIRGCPSVPNGTTEPSLHSSREVQAQKKGGARRRSSLRRMLRSVVGSH